MMKDLIIVEAGWGHVGVQCTSLGTKFMFEIFLYKILRF